MATHKPMSTDQASALTSYFDHLVADDFFMPSQWAATHKPSTWTPEQRLAFAILYEALREINSWLHHRDDRTFGPAIEHLCKTKRERLYDEAIEWISSDDDKFVYSFENICAVLHVAVGPLRRKILSGEMVLRRAPSVYAAGDARPRPINKVRRLVRPNVAT